jgi:hypothetical protein
MMELYLNFSMHIHGMVLNQAQEQLNPPSFTFTFLHSGIGIIVCIMIHRGLLMQNEFSRNKLNSVFVHLTEFW